MNINADSVFDWQRVKLRQTGEVEWRLCPSPDNPTCCAGNGHIWTRVKRLNSLFKKKTKTQLQWECWASQRSENFYKTTSGPLFASQLAVGWPVGNTKSKVKQSNQNTAVAGGAKSLLSVVCRPLSFINGLTPQFIVLKFFPQFFFSEKHLSSGTHQILVEADVEFLTEVVLYFAYLLKQYLDPSFKSKCRTQWISSKLATKWSKYMIWLIIGKHGTYCC